MIRMIVVALGLSFSAAAANTVNVELKDAKGASMGTARLSDAKRGVAIKLDAKGLTAGKHGIHLH